MSEFMKGFFLKSQLYDLAYLYTTLKVAFYNQYKIIKTINAGINLLKLHYFFRSNVLSVKENGIKTERKSTF